MSTAPIYADSNLSYSYGKNHYSYIRQNEDGQLSDVFYRNNEFFRCEAGNICKEIPPGSDEDPKKHAFFLRREVDGFIVPVFLKCNRDGTSFASMAEDLVPFFNQGILDNSDCLDEEALLNSNLSQTFVENTLATVQSYDRGCPVQQRSCGEQIWDGLKDDFSNFGNLFSRSNPEDAQSDAAQGTDAGCFTNLISTVKDSLYQTIKMFVWDLPRGVLNFGRSSWNYFFGEEEEQSEAMLLGSVLPQDMADALADWDLPEFFQLVKRNFFSFFGDIREFYAETLGCTKWSGAPYESECLKKMNWSCPTCENFMNLACGIVGQLGTGFLLGGIMGTAGSLARMRSLRKSVSDNPSAFNIIPQQMREMAAKESVQNMITSTKRASYRLNRRAGAITDILRTGVEEVKLIFAVGDNFRAFTAGNPITRPYNNFYQAGKSRTFRAVNNKVLNRVSLNSTRLGRKYALHLDNIQAKFDNLVGEFYKFRGRRFDSEIVKELQDEFFDEIQNELKTLGVSVRRTDDGAGLAITKAGESFEYRPDFADKLRNMGDEISPSDMRRSLVENDPITGNTQSSLVNHDVPNFWKKIQEGAETTRGLYTIKPSGADGLVYLSQFIAQGRDIPKPQDCSGKLNGVRMIRSHDISDDIVEEAGVDTSTSANAPDPNTYIP